jgi:hypothetical protein
MKSTKIDLKLLYSLNIQKLNSLRSQLSIERLENYKDGSIIDYLIQHKNSINQLIRQQSNIKDRIPYNKLNIVNNFLIDLTGDITSFEEKIGNTTVNQQNIYKTNSALDFNIDPEINMRNTINNQNSFIDNSSVIPPPIPRSSNNSYFDTKINQTSNHKSGGNGGSGGNGIDMNNIDPYELYGIDKKKPINLDELKQKYKTYALQTHPDKNNGETRNFLIVKESFKIIFNDYKLKKNDKQYNELRTDSLGFIEKQTKENKTNTKFNKDNFNLNKFNKVYKENYISDTNDDGYSDWIKDNSFDSEDIKRDNTLTSGNFHDKFNNDVKMTNEMTQYEKPKELFMNDENNCYEIGKQKNHSYTGKTKNIDYTDYKEAHTTNKLIDTSIGYKSYKNLNDIQQSREKIQELTADELMSIEMEKHRKEETEQARINYINKQDRLYSEHYDRINNIMLK